MNYKQKIDRAYDELHRTRGSAGQEQALSNEATVFYNHITETFIIEEGTHKIALTEREMRSLAKYIKRVIIDE